MESELPQWLNKNFLKECLENEEEFRNIIIVSFNVSAAVPPGNNFGSKIIRVNLQVTNEGEGENKPLSLIIKSPLTEGTLSEMLETLKDCEPIFYNEFLPQSNKRMKISFAPKSFKSPLPSVVVLEDLKLKNFSMVDRVKQLDFEHCQLYMNAVASFHAVSFVLSKENPKLISRIGTQKMFDNNLKSAKINKNVNKYTLQSLADQIKNKEHAEIVRNCSTRIWDMLVDAHKPNGQFNCLTQGDPWTTNMMFKYDEDGKVCDIKLLDFQGLSLSPPAHDIVFFMWTSANHNVRKHRFNELYNIYLDALNRNLKCLNCSETLSYDSFMDEVKKMSSLALCLTGWMPCMLHDSAPDLEGAVTEVNKEGPLKENPFDKYFTNSFCDNHLVQYMEELEIHGVLQYLAEYLKANP